MVELPSWVFFVLLCTIIGLLCCLTQLLLKRRAEPTPVAPILQQTIGEKNTQRAVIKGQLAEQLAPLLPGFQFHPSDFRFLGQPIDFIVFDGLTDAKDGGGEIAEIVLGDIKTGNARLSPHQLKIKNAVMEGRVRWATIRIDEEYRLKET
jgi:predicted Holliday junction resolvase-like endonuclease